MTKKQPGPIVTGGAFYGRMTDDGPLLPAGDVRGTPDAWICRRLADYPHATPPDGAAFAACTACGARIVYDPRSPVPRDTPKICFQCSGIAPLPYVP